MSVSPSPPLGPQPCTSSMLPPSSFLAFRTWPDVIPEGANRARGGARGRRSGGETRSQDPCGSRGTPWSRKFRPPSPRRAVLARPVHHQMVWHHHILLPSCRQQKKRSGLQPRASGAGHGEGGPTEPIVRRNIRPPPPPPFDASFSDILKIIN